MDPCKTPKRWPSIRAIKSTASLDSLEGHHYGMERELSEQSCNFSTTQSVDYYETHKYNVPDVVGSRSRVFTEDEDEHLTNMDVRPTLTLRLNLRHREKTNVSN